MKISKIQKEKNRKALVEAAARLCQSQPISDVSMKTISVESGLSESTIYKYFPTKDSLAFGFFEQFLSDAMNSVGESKEFNELSFGDQLKTFFDEYLEKIQPFESYVDQIYKDIFSESLPSSYSGLKTTKEAFVGFVEKQLNQAVAKGEIMEPPFSKFFLEILWDVHLGILAYWLKDSSEHKMNTAQIIDHGVELLTELLKADIFGKTYKLAHFLFKEHLLSKVFSFQQRKGGS